MTGDTHAKASFVTSAIVTVIARPDPPHVIAGFLLALVSSAIPDWIQVNIPFVTIKGLEGHRALSHWALTSIFSAVLLYPYIGYDLAFYWWAGYASHLVLDVFTGYGIYLLGPIPSLISIPLTRNDSTLEQRLGFLSPVVAVSIIVISIVVGA